MLDYISGIAYVSFIAVAIAAPALGLALYLSPRVTSMPARIAIVWSLFVVGIVPLAFVTVLLGGNLYGLLYMAVRHALGW
jgi:hypothetical protein